MIGNDNTSSHSSTRFQRFQSNPKHSQAFGAQTRTTISLRSQEKDTTIYQKRKKTVSESDNLSLSLYLDTVPKILALLAQPNCKDKARFLQILNISLQNLDIAHLFAAQNGFGIFDNLVCNNLTDEELYYVFSCLSRIGLSVFLII